MMLIALFRMLPCCIAVTASPKSSSCFMLVRFFWTSSNVFETGGFDIVNRLGFLGGGDGGGSS